MQQQSTQTRTSSIQFKKMNTDLNLIMLELKCLKLWSSIDKFKLSEMEIIALGVEEYKLKNNLSEAIEINSEVHFFECEIIKKRGTEQRDCICTGTNISEDRFIKIFKSLDWEISDEVTYNILFDRLRGKDRYVVPQLMIDDEDDNTAQSCN